MNDIPTEILVEILSYLPSKSYLPISHVSKVFRLSWLQMKRRDHVDADIYTHGSHSTTQDLTQNEPRYFFESNPLQVGNLFDTHWNQTYPHPTLRTSLFEYYLANGWTNPQNHEHFVNHAGCGSNGRDGNFKGDDSNDASTNNPLLRQVMLGAAARGDIVGMSYLFNHHQRHHHYHLFYHNFNQDTDLCTMAGAAGRLEALKWLLGVQKCKWNPEEVFREASDNLHTDVMGFVEKWCYIQMTENSSNLDENDGSFLASRSCLERLNIQMPYGEGMPW